MEIRYQQGSSDHIAAQRYLCGRLAKNSKWRAVPVIAGGTFGLCIGFGAISLFKFYEEYSYFDLSILSTALAVITLGFAARFLGINLYGRIISARLVDPNGLLGSPQTVTLDDEHLSLASKHCKANYAYRDILAVEEEAGYIFAILDSAVGIYIPTRAFADATAKDRFLAVLKEKVSVANVLA